MNKHDELLEKIEELPEDWQVGYLNDGIPTLWLKSLAADFQLLVDEYEKLREIHDRLEIFLQTEIEAAEWLIRRNERRPSNVEQDWYVQQAYKNILLRLKAQQSGEDGE